MSSNIPENDDAQELGSPKKDEHEQNHGFSGARANKNGGSTICN